MALDDAVVANEQDVDKVITDLYLVRRKLNRLGFFGHASTIARVMSDLEEWNGGLPGGRCCCRVPVLSRARFDLAREAWLRVRDVPRRRRGHRGPTARMGSHRGIGMTRADGGRTALGRPVPCPSCNDGGFTFHKGVLDYVPCPTCRPDEHERRLRYGA